MKHSHWHLMAEDKDLRQSKESKRKKMKDLKKHKRHVHLRGNQTQKSSPTQMDIQSDPQSDDENKKINEENKQYIQHFGTFTMSPVNVYSKRFSCSCNTGGSFAKTARF